MIPLFREIIQKPHTSNIPLTAYWPELCRVISPTCKGKWSLEPSTMYRVRPSQLWTEGPCRGPSPERKVRRQSARYRHGRLSGWTVSLKELVDEGTESCAARLSPLWNAQRSLKAHRSSEEGVEVELYTAQKW